MSERKSGLVPKGLAALCLCLAASPAPATPAAATPAAAIPAAAIPATAIPAGTTAQILAPGGEKPVRATSPEPSAQELLDTWREANRMLPGKNVDKARFLVLDRRFAAGKYPRAFLQFEVLPPRGDALAFASARCPGQTRPVEIQVFYQWSGAQRAWVAQGVMGDGAENLCGDGARSWTPGQVESLMHPPALPVPPKILADDVTAPAAGSPERKAITDALRPLYERIFGAPIEFKVEKMRVAADFAYVIVHPQRRDGAPIEATAWKKALGEPCFQSPATVEHEYWMLKKNGFWTVGLKNGMCADNSIIQQGDLIGAPPQLAGMDVWPEREFPPALNE